MENTSRMSSVCGDDSVSMYFSFNSSTGGLDKTLEAADAVEVSGEVHNSTLEALELEDFVDTHIKTVVKKNEAMAIPKNILQEYKAFSSTPTKPEGKSGDLLKRRSVVTDLGIGFLEEATDENNEKKQEEEEDKENVPTQTQDDKVPKKSEGLKKLRFSVMPPKNSPTVEGPKPTVKQRKSMPASEPDLKTNKPSRISQVSKCAPKIIKTTAEKRTLPGEVPTKKMSRTINQSAANPMPKKPFSLVTKATRQSIVKTTLNSPARKNSRRTLESGQLRRSIGRRSVIPNSNELNRKSVLLSSRKSVMPAVTSLSRRSVIATQNMDPGIRIRKSIAPPRNSPRFPTTEPKPVLLDSKPPLPSHKTDFVKPKKPANLKEEFSCDQCKRKFRVQSNLENHKRAHATVSVGTKPGTSKSIRNQCKYCDKQFAIEKALTNHVLQNCIKIPPAEKKKLLSQGQLPLPLPPVKSALKPLKKLPVDISSSMSSNESLSSTVIKKEATDDPMPPPSSTKIKKKMAHSGIYRTPSKLIACYTCKRNFDNILDYTDHCMTAHPNPNQVANVTTSRGDREFDSCTSSGFLSTEVQTQTNDVLKNDSQTQTANEADSKV